MHTHSRSGLGSRGEGAGESVFDQSSVVSQHSSVTRLASGSISGIYYDKFSSLLLIN
jgi:hypothetical protein